MIARDQKFEPNNFNFGLGIMLALATISIFIVLIGCTPDNAFKQQPPPVKKKYITSDFISDPSGIRTIGYIVTVGEKRYLFSANGGIIEHTDANPE